MLWNRCKYLHFRKETWKVFKHTYRPFWTADMWPSSRLNAYITVSPLCFKNKRLQLRLFIGAASHTKLLVHQSESSTYWFAPYGGQERTKVDARNRLFLQRDVDVLERIDTIQLSAGFLPWKANANSLKCLNSSVSIWFIIFYLHFEHFIFSL